MIKTQMRFSQKRLFLTCQKTPNRANSNIVENFEVRNDEKVADVTRDQRAGRGPGNENQAVGREGEGEKEEV